MSCSIDIYNKFLYQLTICQRLEGQFMEHFKDLKYPTLTVVFNGIHVQITNG
jgi:hypothetical protein